MTDFDAKAVFAEEFAAALAKEQRKSGFPDTDTWFWSGRQKPATSIDWWQANGAELVEHFIAWYEAHEDVSIWITPDGQPAIELELEVNFGSIPVKMAIDVVLQIATALVVVDLKTSAKAPESYRQLGIYASGIEAKYGIRPRYGAYMLPRKDVAEIFQRPIELSAPQYSIPYLTREFEQAEKGIGLEIFPANPGRSCGRCGVAHACLAFGGPKAREHDPSHPSHTSRRPGTATARRSALAPK